MEPQSPDRSKLEELEQSIGCDWRGIRAARAATVLRRSQLDACFTRRGPSDTSLVVFGSVARAEVTSGSDLDWILLIDGQSFPEHKEQEREIKRKLLANEFIEPGASGVFGKMVGSHDLVHNIGGEDDLNSNSTRRVLLLLESYPIGTREAYDRVRRQVIRRYVEDDRGLTHASGDLRVPRFLLNDLTRYWRTVTVDFVYKQVADDDKKWALRNAKLRMSRKLIFAAGLARVFLCHLDPAANEARQALVERKEVSLLTEYLEQQLALTPLELLAKLCVDLAVSQQTSRKIFDSYDAFLSILDDPSKRAELAHARSHDDLRSSKAWGEVRAVSGPFHDGLVSLFLQEETALKDLTMRYGLF
ncbi:MAG: nucleotidyltransferase domain-containing protein [Bryobacteraceae bacterium]